MAKIKTTQNDASVQDFLNAVDGERKRSDSFTILELMREVTGEDPKMWGTSIVGFGSYKYKYASGHEGEAALTGFSPRKQNLTLYIMAGFDNFESLRAKLGKHKVGKACLYINKLDDIDIPTLKKMVKESYDHMVRTNPS